ncbi:CD1375 family protein [Anaerotruncus sp. 1XD42-93]
MAVVYATLIIKGKKTIDDVPTMLREQVKQMLVDLDVQA